MSTPSEEWSQFVPEIPKLKDGKKWHIFLSYSSSTREWVVKLFDILDKVGFKVFMDQYEMHDGDNLVFSLSDGLKKSQAGILVWSVKAATSNWCKQEYAHMEREAIKKRFRYVGIKLDEEDFPGFANGNVYINFSDAKDGPYGSRLCKLLFSIADQKQPQAAIALAVRYDTEFIKATNKIRAAIAGGYGNILVDLANQTGLIWDYNPILKCEVIEGLIEIKKYEVALELVRKVHEVYPNAIRPKQLLGLTLSRLKRNEEAQLLLEELYQAGERGPETLGILAKTWYSRYLKEGEIEDLEHSRDIYLHGFEANPDNYFLGINAAAKSIFFGEKDKGQELAIEVQEIVGKEPVYKNYWLTATVAEVFLILEDYEMSANVYQKAKSWHPKAKGSHDSTYIQAQALMQKLSPTPEKAALIHSVFVKKN